MLIMRLIFLLRQHVGRNVAYLWILLQPRRWLLQRCKLTKIIMISKIVEMFHEELGFDSKAECVQTLVGYLDEFCAGVGACQNSSGQFVIRSIWVEFRSREFRWRTSPPSGEAGTTLAR